MLTLASAANSGALFAGSCNLTMYSSLSVANVVVNTVFKKTEPCHRWRHRSYMGDVAVHGPPTSSASRHRLNDFRVIRALYTGRVYTRPDVTAARETMDGGKSYFTKPPGGATRRSRWCTCAARRPIDASLRSRHQRRRPRRPVGLVPHRRCLRQRSTSHPPTTCFFEREGGVRQVQFQK